MQGNEDRSMQDQLLCSEIPEQIHFTTSHTEISLNAHQFSREQKRAQCQSWNFLGEKNKTKLN